MKLYGTVNSPFARHCRIALLQENQQFEFIDANRDTMTGISPTHKIPYFTEGDIALSDSSSIVKYVREKSNNAFLPAVQDYERFTIASTVMDTLINFRILSAEGHTPDTIQYMNIQLNRAKSGLLALNNLIDPSTDLQEDSTLRAACLVDWGLFRNCIQLDGLNNLSALLDNARKLPAFNETAPPR